MKHFRSRFRRYGAGILAGAVLLALTVIPVRLAIAMHQAPRPQAIFTLGGDPSREAAAAELARHYPSLDVWVSTGETRQKSQAIFRAANIPDDRLHLDYRAVDTVTNFTMLVSDFKQRQIQHVYVVTSDFHMPRAKAIATIVLGSRGITFTPVVVPSDRPAESSARVLRDVGRSILWMMTGRTGTTLHEIQDRIQDREIRN
ncbi:YdcF family protein [Leptolyngbya sp. GB1-A1]|uniref:YdcF family protein n=1 Tax=Leptolyngbya sp. GB1-A1 TaxID=2933908 RepID=UPI00329A4A58